ncbi:MAG: DMT family transporter [Candidatus Levybacteria bacterium]|nr:DMT family transporter [Candidatus Levybacteria bacterium]
MKQGWVNGIVSQILWGTAGFTIKLIDTALPSSLLVSLRHGIGALTLATLIVKSKTSFKNLPIGHLVLLGIFAACLPDLLLVEAIRNAGVIVASMVARVEIPLGVIFAHVLLKEKVTKHAYLAAIISLIGVWFISYKPGQIITLDNTFYFGVLCALGAAILWGISSVYAKYILTKKTDPLALSFVRLSIGSIFALAITILFIHDPFISLQQLQMTDWLLLLYLGIFVSGLAYLFFYRSLAILDAHKAIILLGVSIMVTLFLGLFLGEIIQFIQWIGIALIISSLFLIRNPGSVK